MDQRALFLHQVKLFVEKHGFIFVPREQSLAFMAERGMTMDDLRRVILSLEPKICLMGRSQTGTLGVPRSGPSQSSRLSMRKRRCI